MQDFKYQQIGFIWQRVILVALPRSVDCAFQEPTGSKQVKKFALRGVQSNPRAGADADP
jgi:hypothetical protein